MATIAGADGRRVTICPACGYPRLGVGLCAACIQISPVVPVDPAMNTFVGVSDLNPALLTRSTESRPVTGTTSRSGVSGRSSHPDNANLA
jgi:hypothetical protein